MIDKIEITIVENGVCHTLKPTTPNDYDDSDYAANIVAMLCEVVTMCGINSNYAAERIKEYAKWERE